MSSPRFLRRLASRLDEMVSQIENHEAIAESAIRNVGERLSRAERALLRSGCEGARIGAELAAQEGLSRALRKKAASELDDRTALEWLRRSRHADWCAGELREQARTFQSTTSALECEVTRIKSRLASLEHTRHLLRARGKRAEALHDLVNDRDARDDGMLVAVQRWETQIQHAETAAQATLELAELDRSLTDDESDLMLELAELRRKQQ